MDVKIAGQEIFRCSEDKSCSESKSRTAAENESYERYHKENQKQKVEWITVGGSVSCWPLPARKRDSMKGWEDTMQKWYDRLPEMKKKGEVKKMYEERQKKVSQMIKCADGSAGLLHKITKPTARRGGVHILKK